MNKLDEMIRELCPNGVDRVKLGELLDYEQPTRYIVNSAEYDDSNPVPVLTAGQSFILGYTDEQTGIFKASKEFPVIIFDDFTTGFHWVDFDFKVKSSAMKILMPKDSTFSFRYVYFAMRCIGFVPTEHTRHWISKYSQFEIPLPPLPIQQEIVSILDKFTGHISHLNEALEQRQKQYEYYKEKLLTFEDGECEWKTLGEITTIKGRIGFKGYTKNDFVGEKEGAISLSPGDIKDNKLYFDNCSYITWKKYEESPEIMINKGDIVLCKTGSTVGKVAIVEELPWKSTINPQFVVLKEIRNNNKFLFYFLTKSDIQQKIKREAGVGSVPNISQAKLSELLIHTPPLAKQSSIVATLDKFETHIAHLKEMIDLRQKQYEYYREKLLTF